VTIKDEIQQACEEYLYYIIEITDHVSVESMAEHIVEKIAPTMGEAQAKLLESLEVARQRARDAEDQANEDRRLLVSMTQRYHRTLELLSISEWPVEDEDRYAAIRADYDSMFADAG
jgi:hypothetical protein